MRFLVVQTYWMKDVNMSSRWFQTVQVYNLEPRFVRKNSCPMATGLNNIFCLEMTLLGSTVFPNVCGSVDYEM